MSTAGSTATGRSNMAEPRRRAYRNVLQIDNGLLTAVSVEIAGGAVKAHDYGRRVDLKGPLFRVQDQGTGAPLQFRTPLVHTVYGHDFATDTSFSARVIGARVDLFDDQAEAPIAFIVS